uniref:CRIB domain-containing protein n=1 Tax=Aquila chrysaetos chrysaetos TaxID=223781 RepID=A0A663ECU3_AQUCH
MPILKQLVSNSAHSKRRSRADLTAEMISAPLGDFRHTMHVGREGLGSGAQKGPGIVGSSSSPGFLGTFCSLQPHAMVGACSPALGWMDGWMDGSIPGARPSKQPGGHGDASWSALALAAPGDADGSVGLSPVGGTPETPP